MRTLVLGLGNILLRDEGVGVRVVEALAARYILPADVEVVDGGTAGMELLNTLAGCDHLLICDAVQTDAPPATVIELVNTEVPAFFQTTRFSPHQLGLADVLATLTLTDEAPRTGFSLRTARYRYTIWPDGSEELFDLRADPSGRKDLGRDPAQASVRAMTAFTQDRSAWSRDRSSKSR